MTLPAGMLRSVAEQLVAQRGVALDLSTVAGISGGCIHRSFAVSTTRGERYFLKCNDRRAAPMLAAEEAGLKALAATGELRLPGVIARGETATAAWLLLEHLDLKPATPRGDRVLGAGLARLHRHSCSSFGFPEDNFIGATPQLNASRIAGSGSDWLYFFGEQRLAPQLRLAARNKRGSGLPERGKQLLDHLPILLAGHNPVPSLVHGDLWSGNRAVLADDTPVIYDPAVYYGDRETDIAMTRLFGGFSPAFYHAYNDEWPLPAGFEQRCELYNLYHVLNHLNLFGGSYLQQAMAIMKRLLEHT